MLKIKDNGNAKFNISSLSKERLQECYIILCEKLKKYYELKNYLKEQIKSLKNDLKGTKGQERYFLKQVLSIYEEILSKMERIDK